MKYYVIDNTQKNKSVYFDNLPSVVNYLEEAVKRKFRQNRSGYMQNLIDLGHGPDDPNGKNFVGSLYQHFEIGVVKQLRHVPCNIHEATQYSGYRQEMGD